MLKEDVSLFKTALKELIEEQRASESGKNTDRQSKIETLIQEDFDSFESVYKALA